MFDPSRYQPVQDGESPLTFTLTALARMDVPPAAMFWPPWMKETPGVSCVSCQNERPFSGTLCTVCVSITWPTDDDASLSSGVCAGDDLDLVADRAHVQRRIDGRALRHLQFRIGNLRLGETLMRNRHGVVAHLQIRHGVDAAAVRPHNALFTRAQVPDRDRGTGNGSAGVIQHRTQDRAGIGLRDQRRNGCDAQGSSK